MCGIIGATGCPDVTELLVEGLERLEYRGYDSAGLVLAAAGSLWRVRAAEGTTSVRALRQLAAGAPDATTGLGHTRWATHGHPSVENAHPLFDCTGRVGVVHNGIIENHAEIGERLVAAGHTMASETDTEVLAHLVEEHLKAGLGPRRVRCAPPWWRCAARSRSRWSRPKSPTCWWRPVATPRSSSG